MGLVSKIILMFLVNLLDKLLFGNTSLPCADHDGCAVSVITTNINALVSLQFLEPDPNVGLNVLHQMADVDRAIRIGEPGGGKDLPHASSDRKSGVSRRVGIVAE